MVEDVEFEVVPVLTLKGRGGDSIGEMNLDKSDDIENMKYAERLVTNTKFITKLADLSVATTEKVKTDNGTTEKQVKGGTILLTKEQIAKFRDEDDGEVEMITAANMINKVFVALEIPYFAKAWASDDAPEVERTKTRGDNAGEKYTVVPADKLRVYRISEKFNVDNYYAAKSAKVVKGEVKNASHEPTQGMIARENKWLLENAKELAEVFKKLGFEVTQAASSNT